MKFHEFYLLNPSKGGTMSRELSDGNYRPISFPPTRTIPSVARVTDIRPDSKTFGRPTTIRYVEGEPSIWTDEQTDDFSVDAYKHGRVRATPITFVDGRLRVSSDNSTLLEFLRAHRMNQENFDKYGQVRRGFYEYKPEVLSTKKLQHTERAFNLEAKIRSMDVDRLQSIARITGIVPNTNDMFSIPPSEIRWELIARVRSTDDQAVTQLEKLLNDPLTDLSADILMAIDTGRLVWGGISGEMLIVAGNGQIICKIPAGEDRLTYAARYITDQTPETIKLIRNLIGRLDRDTELIEGKTKAEVIDEMIEYQREELKGKEDKLLTAVGAEIHFNGIPLTHANGKGYTAAKNHLLEPDNHETFSLVYKEYKKMSHKLQD